MIKVQLFADEKINKAIKKKFISPLKDGCNYNIAKLERERRTNHSETISLLKQAHKTLINVDFNLKNYNFVDANILLRSAFEYIMMAMMIQFDEKVYNEFIALGMVRDKTRVCEIIDKFRTHMNEICEPAFKDINRRDKLVLLNELYDKMCNFTHSSLIVSTVININSLNEKKVLQLFMYQNYYFIELLLFLCLKYFTNDVEHYIELRSVGFSFIFFLIEACNKIKKYNMDFSKYNNLLYYNKNIEYFKKGKPEMEKLSNEINEFINGVQNDSKKLYTELLEFLM